MEFDNLTDAGARRYYMAILSAYNSTRKKKTPPKEKPAPILPSPEEIRQAKMKEMERKLQSLEKALAAASPQDKAGRQQHRKLQTKIDIFRSKMEKLPAESVVGEEAQPQQPTQPEAKEPAPAQ